MSKQIKTIWDNGGKTYDRYTVVLVNGGCLGLSENPEHLQGFSQFGDCGEGKHLGKRVRLSELSKELRKHIRRRLEED